MENVIITLFWNLLSQKRRNFSQIVTFRFQDPLNNKDDIYFSEVKHGDYKTQKTECGLSMAGRWREL